jgi:hypothetical protein
LSSAIPWVTGWSTAKIDRVGGAENVALAKSQGFQARGYPGIFG